MQPSKKEQRMKTKKRFNLGLLASLLALAVMMTSCASIQKLIDQGRYDDAFELAVRKVAGKKNKKPKYVAGLETAFERLTQRDMKAIENLKKDDRPSNWVKINNIHERIARRQSIVEPILPLYDKNGYKATFSFVRVDDMMQESREKAAAYYYAIGQKSLVEAEAGDKRAARRAYEELNKTKKYFKPYRDRQALMQRAHELGTAHIVFEMKNNAHAYLPAHFEQEILRISTNDMNSFWNQFHLNKEEGKAYDYKVVMNIRNIDVSPERMDAREYVDRKEVRDGYEYVLDENGNVAKDSLGNDIKVERYKIIEAFVLETTQHKAAIVGGYLEYFDLETNNLLRSDPISVEAVFTNCAATYRGNYDALSRDSRRRIGNVPMPFPRDEDLLVQAAQDLKPIVKDRVGSSQFLP